MHIIKKINSLLKQIVSYIYNKYTILKFDFFNKKINVFFQKNGLQKLSQLFKRLYICVI